MTQLDRSVAAVTALLQRADLSGPSAARELLELTTERRRLDLSDLDPKEQAALIAERAQLQPGAEALAERIAAAAAGGRRFVAKFGIDPTGSEVHLGHAVPMIVLSRFSRLGHEVVFIVGDVTAKIGDPSGRSDERPPLTDEQIAANLATYRQQVSPFFDFSKAQFRYNGDWLRTVTLPRVIEITSQIPLSMPLQREDFRKRLDAGQGLSMAELLYSVAMALDSVETRCDLEVGGVDQYLNMQMCRKVMEVCGLAPEIVVATPLIEGTDGSGAKMSKSRGNYVAITDPPDEVFGKLMSVPDRLVAPYLQCLSEWRDSEIAILSERVAGGTVHPMDAKRLLAGEVTAALHGVEAAMRARDSFSAQFSRRSFSELELPVVPAGWLDLEVVEVLRQLGFVPSRGEARRIAQGNGVRLVAESGGVQEQAVLGVDEVMATLRQVVAASSSGLESPARFLRVGRRVARIELSGP